MSFSNLKAQLAADKKKSIVLGGLLCVLLVVAVRAFRSGSTPELAAAGSPRPAAVEPGVIKPIDEKVNPRPEPAPTSLAPPPTPQATTKRRVTALDHSMNLTRDLFMTEQWADYPLEGSQVPKLPISTGPDFWSKLSSAIRQYSKQRHEESASVLKELSDLHLQSTLTGAEPLAYISGHVVRPGDVCAGFVVLRIEERRVVLEKYGQVHELVMH